MARPLDAENSVGRWILPAGPQKRPALSPVRLIVTLGQKECLCMLLPAAPAAAVCSHGRLAQPAGSVL